MNFLYDSVQDQAQVMKLMPRLADPKVISAAATQLTTGLSPVTLFSVDGDCLVRVLATVQTSVTSTSSTGTLEVGVTGNTAVLMPQTTANGTNLTAGSAWVDNSPTVKAEALPAATAVLNWALVASGADIIATIATNSMTAGALTFYCQYIPLSRDARVIAA